jgi:hypothetical protein
MPTTTTTTTTTTTASGGTTTTTTTTVTSVPAATTRSVPAATTPSYPNSLAEVSVEWLSELLGSTVASFEARPILNGAMGDAAVITPTYAEAGSGVPSLFLKYQKEAEQARGMAMVRCSSAPAAPPRRRCHGTVPPCCQRMFYGCCARPCQPADRTCCSAHYAGRRHV